MLRLVSKMFSVGSPEASKWVSNLFLILSENGYGNLFTANCTDFNAKWLKKSFQLRTSDIANQNWSMDVLKNKLCLNYRIFKKELEFENYLIVLPPALKYSFSKFRCGNNNLPYMRARFSGTENGRCDLCNSQDLGDEFHYVLVCKFFEVARKSFIKPYYFKYPNSLKFHDLMSSKTNLIKLAKFIDLIMKQFSPF